MVFLRSIKPFIERRYFVKVIASNRFVQTDANKPVKLSLYQRAKEGVVHYWNGSKLLAMETRISARLLGKVLRGESLIRREYRQLLRTSSDLFRLVPFIIIAVIPFLEFALPLILKLFPNLLPSTFEHPSDKENKMKKQLKVKLETAKFLREISEEMTNNSEQIKSLKVLFEKSRREGSSLKAEEVMSLAQTIGEDLTLENMNRPQLLSMCRYMGLRVFGTDNYLRYQVKKAIDRLKEDDKMISREGGSASLDFDELKTACHVRGIRSINVTEGYMRSELQQWLDLQLKFNIPAPLLILSRAFALADNVDFPEALEAAVKSLPDNIIEETQVGGDAEEKIKILEAQEELISKELEQTEQMKREVEGQSDSSAALADLTEAISSLSPNDLIKRGKEELDDLKREKISTSSPSTGTTTDSTKEKDDISKKLEDQVDRLINDLDEDIADLQEALKAKYQGNAEIAVEVIDHVKLKELISKSLKDEKLDKDALFNDIVNKLDKEGSGEINLNDLNEYLKERQRQ